MNRFSTQRPQQQRGQSLIEGTFVMLVFFALLLGVADFGQTVVAHQSLVERVRGAVRWGTIHPWNGPEPIRNLILYGQAEEPNITTMGFLGLKAENIVVSHRIPTPERPDDDTLTVEVRNFETQLFSPWLAGSLITPRPVAITAPMAYRAVRPTGAAAPIAAR